MVYIYVYNELGSTENLSLEKQTRITAGHESRCQIFGEIIEFIVMLANAPAKDRLRKTHYVFSRWA